jgi:ribose 5-phosphate isomerase B
MGTDSRETTNYPLHAQPVCDAVLAREADLGILICGSGVGISIAANKVRGIRAVVCSEPYSAKLAREHNDANVLAFGARVVGPELAKMITDAFLEASFQQGIHVLRLEMVAKMERGERV